MRPRFVRLALLIGLQVAAAASCAPPVAVDSPTPVAATASAPALPTVPHATEIRFALVGRLTNANVWELFDSTGYSYNDYVVRSGYWPRLFHLTTPDGRFEPQVASGPPSPIQAEGAFYTATVPLRSDLKWTDGTPFTAEDVAFTVNTALSFQLGFDWHAYYDPAWLNHAEAIDLHTVKFYFKHAPGVAEWQYGALQGPVAQKNYWSSKVSDAAALLPPADSLAKIESLKAREAALQLSVQGLIKAGIGATGEQARQLQSQLQNQQGDLDEARNDLNKAQAEVDSAMQAARQSLYALQAADEPSLGTWMPAEQTSANRANSVNPSHPFGSPNFDIATYSLYLDEASALQALKKGEVNSILQPGGLSPGLAAGSIAGAHIISNETSSANFIVLNPVNPALADPALRRALFCSVDRLTLARTLAAAPLASIVPASNAWAAPAAGTPCGEAYDPTAGFDPARAVAILKEAGYRWALQPSGSQGGAGLTGPDGQVIRPLSLLAPFEEVDPQGGQAAQLLQQAVRYLGIPFTVLPADPADIRFAVFNDRDYDMALMGWRLSAYPGYLCDWFGDANPFGYDKPQVRADCAVLRTTSDPETARRAMVDIQTLLVQDPPFIPLYSGLTYDIVRGIVYPFDRVMDGLSSIYGAPSVAIPAPP